MLSRLQEWAIVNPEDIEEIRWGFTNDAPDEPDHRQSAPELWVAARVADTRASDTSRRKIHFAQMNPRSASQMAGTLTGVPPELTRFGQASREASVKVSPASDDAVTGGLAVQWLK